MYCRFVVQMDVVTTRLNVFYNKMIRQSGFVLYYFTAPPLLVHQTWRECCRPLIAVVSPSRCAAVIVCGFPALCHCLRVTTVSPAICHQVGSRMRVRIRGLVLQSMDRVVLIARSLTQIGQIMGHCLCLFCALWSWFTLPFQPHSSATIYMQVSHFRPDRDTF